MVTSVFVLLFIYQITVNTNSYNNASVINKKPSEKCISVLFYRLYFLLKFVRTVSAIISSSVITESSIILAKYFRYSQTHVLGFQI